MPSKVPSDGISFEPEREKRPYSLVPAIQSNFPHPVQSLFRHPVVYLNVASWETIASLGLSNFSIVVQLIFRPKRREHQNKQIKIRVKLSSLRLISLDATKINTMFEGKFATLNYEYEV